MLSVVTSVLDYTLQIHRLYHIEYSHIQISHIQNGLATTKKAPFPSS